MAKTSAQDLGQRGEDFAVDLYRRLGMRILARNVRFDCGEVDFIALSSDNTYVFVEVKTRSGLGFGGAESVTPRKLSRIRQAAARWLVDRPYAPVRIDVVELIEEGGSFEPLRYEGVTDGAR